MVTVKGDEINIGDSIQLARDAVSGKPVHDALKAFADLHRINVRDLREAALKNLSRSPFLASIPKVYSSHDGRVIARTPGIGGPAPSEDDEAEVLAQMNRVEYGTRVGITVQALILPALDVLTLEHRLRTADLIYLARRSPIVPIGREVLFGKALAHGFNRDAPFSLVPTPHRSISTRRTLMTITTELTPLLKRLKLGAVLNTLPERVALARRDHRSTSAWHYFCSFLLTR